MKRYLIIGALLASAITSHANIGDSRADSAKRYGQPSQRIGNREIYTSNQYWMIIQWFNPAGYVEVVSYHKHDGVISQAESQKFLNANVRATNWYEIEAKGDSREAIGRIWLTVDNAFRYESGSSRWGDRWLSYLEISTAHGHLLMTEENQQNQQQQQTSNSGNDYLPL